MIAWVRCMILTSNMAIWMTENFSNISFETAIALDLAEDTATDKATDTIEFQCFSPNRASTCLIFVYLFIYGLKFYDIYFILFSSLNIVFSFNKCVNYYFYYYSDSRTVLEEPTVSWEEERRSISYWAGLFWVCGQAWNAFSRHCQVAMQLECRLSDFVRTTDGE